MSESSTLSLRVDKQISDRLETLAGDSGVTKSQLARRALYGGLEDLEDVPADLEDKAERERVKQEYQTERRRGWFRSNFSDGMTRAFEDGLTPDEFEASVRPYLEEAERLGALPADVADSTGCETYLEWCEDMLEYYAAAYEQSNWDAEADLNAPLEGFDGVQAGRQWADRAVPIAEADGAKQERLAKQAIRDSIVPEDVLEADALGETPPERVIAHAHQTADGYDPMTETEPADTSTDAPAAENTPATAAADGGRTECRECGETTLHTDADGAPLCPVCAGEGDL
jgi:predicted DNA-binding protein